MGRMTTIGLIDSMKNDEALRIHLQCNHYPPLPSAVFGLAKRAIAKAKKGLWDSNISLRGTGIKFRGKDLAPVSNCIESWHLDEFLN